MEKATFTNVIRKNITLKTAEEVIEEMYGNTLGLKIKLAEKE